MIHCPGKFVFIHVPRTGGTAISTALCAAFPESRWGAQWAHATIGTVRSHTILGQATKDVRFFAFVRNPYLRMLSWFGNAGGAHTPLDEARDAYVAFLKLVPGRPVWRTAWHLLSVDGELAVDRLGRTETLQEDFADICGWLGATDIPTVNRMNGSKFTAPPDAYYDERSRDLVRLYCAEDFEHFGYDMDRSPI